MNQILPFKLGEETYALKLADIQEIVENQLIYPLPGAPATLAGAISFHGRIVPVIDLPALLGFTSGQSCERLIVLTDEHGPMALQVNLLLGLQNINIAHGTLSQTHSEKDCIAGVLNLQGEMISLLDLGQLLLTIEHLCLKTGG